MSTPTQTASSIGHFDVAGPDLERLGPFYTGVFGWQIAPRGPGYAQLQTPADSPNGALVEQADASVTLGIVVPDLAHALAQAEATGGRVEMPATDNGWVRKAQVRDPAGNLLTLIQGD